MAAVVFTKEIGGVTYKRGTSPEIKLPPEVDLIRQWNNNVEFTVEGRVYSFPITDSVTINSVLFGGTVDQLIDKLHDEVFNPVSGALPTGAATETTLAALNTKFPAKGAATIANSTPVNIASDQIVPVREDVQTTGGATMFILLSAATTNATNVKSSAGQIFGIQVNNTNAAVRYLKLYNKATAPTVGTDTPVKTIAIPPGTLQNIPFPRGIVFSLGISFALTALSTVADTTIVGANEHVVNIDYK